MHVTIPRVEVTLNYSECVDIFRSITTAMKYTIFTHWRRHKDAYLEGEAPRLYMLRELCRITGHNYEWESKLLTDFLASDEPL